MTPQQKQTELIRIADLTATVQTIPGTFKGPPLFGIGSPDAKLVMVSSAPYPEELVTTEAFSGEVGVVLKEALVACGLTKKDVYITYAVKMVPVYGGGIRRSPTAAEVSDFRGILKRELRLVAPRVVLCLGSVATRAVLNLPPSREPMMRAYTVPDLPGMTVMCTKHPEYVLKRGGVGRYEYRQFVEDIGWAKKVSEAPEQGHLPGGPR